MSLLIAVAALFALPGCNRNNSSAGGGGSGDAWFEDVTAKSGVQFVHDAGSADQWFMPEVMGSGAALFDFDNSGRLGLYLVQNGGPGSANSKSTNKLFRQNGDGTFTDVSAGSGLDIAGYGMGVAVGDINNDGLPDVLVTGYGGVHLFLNQGGGKFKDVTAASGIVDPHWSVSAAFFDLDRDGWLDLVIVNYVQYDPSLRCPDPSGRPDYCGPRSFPGTVTQLFHNLGPQKNGLPRFEEITEYSGLSARAGPGLGVACLDFDGDGWPDILVTNDAKPNHLWINRHDGTFEEQAPLRGIAYDSMGETQANMGIAAGDVRGSGMFDVFVTHLTEEHNALWVQGPRGSFQERTGASGLTSGAGGRGTGFGATLADFDNDGFPDLAVTNGRVRRPSGDPGAVPGLSPHWALMAERDQLFVNDGTGGFRDVSPSNPAFTAPHVGRGLVVGDLDNDGGLDLVVTSVAGPVRLFRNVAPGRGHWLTVRATDPALGGRDAYGAVVTVEAGGASRVAWVNPELGYAGSNDPRAHFGLGGRTRVDRISVRWPDGYEELFPGTAADQVLTVRRGQGAPAPVTQPATAPATAPATVPATAPATQPLTRPAEATGP